MHGRSPSALPLVAVPDELTSVHPVSRGLLILRRVGVRVPAILGAAVLLVATPAAAIGSFSSSVFKFTTVVKDDGRGKAGGWQEASAPLTFGDARGLIPRIWTCNVTVGMPLRAVAYGPVLSNFAAEVAASVATRAPGVVMHLKEEWLTADFCLAFKNEMNKVFREDYERLGAKVSVP
jgi:hypothetical protein